LKSNIERRPLSSWMNSAPRLKLKMLGSVCTPNSSCTWQAAGNSDSPM
jgi:hypothetical protein